MSQVAGLYYSDIIKIKAGMDKSGITVEELTDALENDDFLVAKQKSRIIYLEAKLNKIEKLLNDRQED